MKKRKLEGEFRKTATRRRGKKTPKSEPAKIPLDARGYPTGKDGTVWATFDLRQAEIIRNALLTQRIACELRNSKLDGKALYLLRLAGEGELEEAMQFIWKDKGGLRLLPDWSYREGEVNKSFERWLSGQ
jgi:hypothetical protein